MTNNDANKIKEAIERHIINYTFDNETGVIMFDSPEDKLTAMYAIYYAGLYVKVIRISYANIHTTPVAPPLPSLDPPAITIPAWVVEAESQDDRNVIVDEDGKEFPDPNHVDQSVIDVCTQHGHITEDFVYIDSHDGYDGVETCTRCGRIVNCDADGFERDDI
jgi:hypothetical protein